MKTYNAIHNFPKHYFHNILRPFDVLPFVFSPEVKRSAIITYKHGTYELFHEFPNDLNLKVLENYKILGRCVNLIE